MMKKTLLAILLIGVIFGIGFPTLRAYSPNYLPGGKNYLCVDNFQYSNGHLYTIEAFLVKPYTYYTLTIPRDYSENAFGSPIEIEFFEGEDSVDSLTLDAGADFTPVFGSIDCYYATFQTGATINFLSLVFEQGREPISLNTISEMQLEEGTSSSAAVSIDPYVPGTVTDVNGPYFQGSPVVISDVSLPLTVADIQSGISAYDGVDGDVTSEIEMVSDQYTGNAGTLGNYTVLFRVADGVGNTTEFTMTVMVVDVTDPVITGPSSVIFPFTQIRTLEQLSSLLSASDNYDGPLSQNITVTSDLYTPSSSKVGDYPVVFSVSDSSGNTQTFTMTVSVVDTEAPIFSGISEVTIGYDQVTSAVQIQKGLSAIDGYDGVITSSIVLVSDGYSGHIHEVGDYLIVYEVSDTNGNTTQKTVIVSVVDVIGPILYFDSSIVRVYNSTVLTMEDFTNLLLRTGELEGAHPYKAAIRFDSYSGHETTPGTYHLILDMEDSDGKVISKTFQIIVGEREGLPTIPDLIPDPLPSSAGNLSWIIGSVFIGGLGITNVSYLLIRKKRFF